MSWLDVKSALNKMRDEGSDGFEGFVGVMLGQLFGQPFVTARQGDQPGGDGRSYDGNIRFQTKHYTAAKIQDSDIIADFHRIRIAYPSLDTYVVGSASPLKEQLRSALDDLEIQFGVQIVSLDYATEHSPLTLLLFGFWEQARRFRPLDKLGGPTVAWIEDQGKRDLTKQELEKFRISVTQSAHLFAVFHETCLLRLRERFGFVGGDTSFRYPIDLQNSVPRPSVKAFTDKWRKSQDRLLILGGAEGMGKSWSAAGCAHDWATDPGTAVLWLESDEWSGFQTVSEVVAWAFRQLPLKNVVDATAWCRKIENLWTDRIVIFLDGVNEGGALPTAQHFLMSVRGRNHSFPRIVFTTRPLDRRHEYDASKWRGLPTCKIIEFNDDEFPAALARLPKPLRRDEIPRQLESWARIPKLLRTCARLRDQFGGLASVTREIILWADLLDKIANTNSQVRATLGWRDNEEASALLAKLAGEFLKTGSREVEGSKIADFFKGDYREVLVALEELRLADKAEQIRTTVSTDFNILGLALLIRERLRIPPFATVRDQADEWRSFLEPLADVDERANAIFVALQLTAISPPMSGVKLSDQRAALLYAWAMNHNSNVLVEHLLFWAKFDCLAYTAFVEAAFEEPLSDGAMRLIVGPLAEASRSDARVEQAIRPTLQRWLLFCWPDSEAILQFEVVRDGCRLPVPLKRAQLHLTLAALTVMSGHPRNDWLPDLAAARATLEYSVETFLAPVQPRPDSEKKAHQHHLKLWEPNFGALMRFGYGEQCLPELQRLVAASNGNSAMQEGLRQLAASLGPSNLPPELALKPPDFMFLNPSLPARELLRQGRRLYPADSKLPHVREWDFSELAIRHDLPEMHTEDQKIILQSAEKALCSPDFDSHGRAMSEADHDWSRFSAWFARYAPGHLLDLMSSFRDRAFASSEPLRAFLTAEDFVHRASVLPSSVLLEKAKEFWLGDSKVREREIPFLAYRFHHLALLNFTPSEVVEWLNFSSAQPALRKEIARYPYNSTLRELLPAEVTALARHKIKEFANEPAPISDDEAGQFDFWARLVAVSASADHEMFDWVLEHIRKHSPTGDRKFKWLCLLFSFAPTGRLAVGFTDGSLLDVLDRDAVNTAWFMERQLESAWLKSIPYEKLLDLLPVGEVGKIALGNGDREGFSRWGRELLGRALEIAGHEPPERRYWGNFVLEFDRAGHVAYQSIIFDQKKPSKLEPNRIGKPEHVPLEKLFEEETEQRNEALKLAVADYEDLEQAAADYFDFGGLPVLSEWCRGNPAEFLRLARPLLEQTQKRPDRVYHLASLIHAVLCNFLALEPDNAIGIYDRLMAGGIRTQCNTADGVPQFQAALWNAGECGTTRHNELRVESLRSALNEREILDIAIAASGNGSCDELQKIAQMFIESDNAKDRAIGVSVLAWLPSPGNEKLLDDLSKSAPVRWLRKHAGWAAEINRQNLAGIEFYRRVLEQTDPARISTMLVQLERGLTPLAHCWRRRVEAEVLKNRQINGRPCALVNLFWTSWRHNGRKEMEFAGRKLDQWRHGEEVRRIEAPQPFPFFKIHQKHFDPLW